MTSFYGNIFSGSESIDTSNFMQKNNPIFEGTLTGDKAEFNEEVIIQEPVNDNNPATKKYVDTKIANIEGSSGIISYTQGNGITISSENKISININQNSANGLKIDSNGLSLENATASSSGAMSATDKQNLNTTIQEIQNIKNGITNLPYIKEKNGSFSGTLTGENVIFTGSVQIREPIEENEATNKNYIDNKINNIELSYYIPVVNKDGDLSWEGNKEEMPPIPSTNIKGPQYILTEEDKQVIVQRVLTALPNGDEVSY